MSEEGFTTSTVKSLDGTELSAYKFVSTDPKTQLVIVHGYLEHGMRYKEFAKALNANNIDVIVYDVRGHGKSSGTRAYVGSFEEYHEDLDSILSCKELVNESIPTFILGHSNGGLIVLSYLMEKGKTKEEDKEGKTPKIQGTIITSPWLGPASKLSWVKIKVSKLLGYYFPSLTLPTNDDEVGGKVLTRDPEKVKDHDEDEMNLKHITIGWAYQSMLTQEVVVKDCKHLDVPLLYTWAEKDRVADPHLNKKFGQMISADDKTILERKDAYHEVLNDPDRVELYGIISDWMLKRV